MGQLVVRRPGPHGPEVHRRARRRLGHGAADERGAEGVAVSAAGAGVDHVVEHGGAVQGAGEEGDAHHRPGAVGHDEPPAPLGPSGSGDGAELRLGQGRGVVGRSGARQQACDLVAAGLVQIAQVGDGQFRGMHSGQRNPVP